MPETPTNNAPNSSSRDDDAERKLHIVNELIANVLTTRKALFRQLLDPRRDIEDECGYPPISESVSPETYQQLFNRDSYSARVVEVLPRESWQTQPIVYEDDSSNISTEFEKAWDGLAKQLRGEGSFFKDDKGSPVWEYLRRVDELSGIGQFGILLIGIDDGLPLSMPIEGFNDQDSAGPFATEGNAPKPQSTSIPKVPSPKSAQSGQGSQSTTHDPNSSAGLAPPHISPSSLGDTEKSQTPPPPTQWPFTGDPATGADAQYFQTGSILPASGLFSGGSGTPAGDGTTGEDSSSQDRKSTKRKLIFLRVYPESMVQIIQYESRPTSPRFGQPIRYLVTVNDPRQGQSGVGLPLATLEVHWSRVIHVADIAHTGSSSEVFAIPRMQPVLNNLLGLRKLHCGSPEMFWKGAFPGMSLETNPQLGGDVKVDKAALQDMWEDYQNGLQRALFLMGMTAKTLAPTVADPTGQIDVQITAICIKLGMPKRIFNGSERGELASSQDDQAWNDRLKERRYGYITPRIIVPFVDRLIGIGILPKPKVRKPRPQSEEPFALKPEPAQPTHAIGPDGQPMPLVGGGPPGKGGMPGGGFGGPKPPGSFPPKPATGMPKPTVPGAKPAFPPKPSMNQRTMWSSDKVHNAPFPPKRPMDDGTAQDISDTQGEDQLGQQDPSSEDTSTGLTPTRDGLPDNTEMDPLGISPQALEPEEPGYRIEWPDLTSQSDSEKATIANTLTTALAAYIAGGVDELVPPLEFLTKICKMDEDTAYAIIEAARKAQEQAKQEEAMQSPPPVPNGPVDPETGEPLPPKLDAQGNPLPPDEGGNQGQANGDTSQQDAAFSDLAKKGPTPPVPVAKAPVKRPMPFGK